MKVPPKRKGNALPPDARWCSNASLNESPSEKEGKSGQREEKIKVLAVPSMKVPPKRKGNLRNHRFPKPSHLLPQ